MTIAKRLIQALFFLVLSEAEANPWAKVDSPAQIGPIPESIGSYNGGCLSGAVALPINGTGYQVMRLSRNRVFGHPDLKNFIENLGQNVAAEHLGVILVGDLGQVRGGPTPSGHRSHQSGLDVDIWFLLSEKAEKHTLSASERESWGAPSVLHGSSDDINPAHWTQNNEKVLEAAARMSEVDRIFVNASIKRHLCIRTTGDRTWLRKIRPWWKHDDHFHVRLKCPAGSKHCDGQEALPKGDGCDSGLAWWFSDEAKHPTKPSPPPKAPVLPALCDLVLKNKH